MERRSLVDRGASRGRSSIAVSLGLFANALIGLAQALALIAIVGAGNRTDAFLAAYSIYLPIVLLGATLRGQLIPLAGRTEPEDEFRRRAAELGGRATLVGAIFSLALIALAPLTARLVAHGLPSNAQSLAVASLVVLGPVAFLQFRGVILSGLLAAARRFVVSSGIFVVSSLIGLGFSVALLFALGPIGVAIGLFAGAAALAGGHEAYARRLGLSVPVKLGWLAQRRQWAFLAWITGYAALALAQQLNLAIALGGVSGEPGAITVYSLSFNGTLVALNLTSVSLGLVLLPDLVSDLEERGRAAARAYLVRVAGFTFALLAPMLVALVADGRALMLFALDGILSRADILLAFDLARVFAVLALPLALTQTGIAIAVALKRWRLMYGVAAGWVALQLIAVAIASPHGIVAVAWAQTAAMAVASVALLAGLFGGELAATLRETAPPIAKAFALASIVAIVRLPLGADSAPGAVLAVLVLGLVVYALALRRLWPEVGAPLTDRFLPSWR